MAPRSASDRALLAPGASDHVAYAPARGASLPPVDERIVMPETRAEVVNGQLHWALPADMPHATKHLDLAYVLAAHVAPGYRGAVDMLTRTSENSDFAPDASVFRLRANGMRKLEELAFEISDKQRISVPTDKARELSRRGVRRIFALLVKHARVLEWSAVRDEWQILSQNTGNRRPLLVPSFASQSVARCGGGGRRGGPSAPCEKGSRLGGCLGAARSHRSKARAKTWARRRAGSRSAPSRADVDFARLRSAWVSGLERRENADRQLS